MYLLDTNAISELVKSSRARVDRNVAAWDKTTSQELKFLSVITVRELEVGVLLLERRDPVQGQRLRRLHEQILYPAFRGRILKVTEPIARRCAALHVPKPKPELDALIAATALVHDMVVVTRNLGDFENTGVRVLNPWVPA